MISADCRWLLQIAADCRRLPLVAGNCRRLPLITAVAVDCRRLPQVAEDYHRLSLVAADCCRLSLFAEDYRILTLVAVDRRADCHQSQRTTPGLPPVFGGLSQIATVCCRVPLEVAHCSEFARVFGDCSWRSKNGAGETAEIRKCSHRTPMYIIIAIKRPRVNSIQITRSTRRRVPYKWNQICRNSLVIVFIL